MPDKIIPKKILKEMRYISDQQGIMNRYFAESKGWKEHLQNSRSFILENIKKHKPETVMILGSGWLLDVPLDELLTECKKVYLVDIHHPSQVQHQVRKVKNVQLISTDITGGAVQQVYDLVKAYKKDKLKKPLDTFSLHHPDLPVADYHVSLNLLNQLDILLVDHIRRNIDFRDAEITGFRKLIQHHHLSLLETGSSCLITDIKEIIINRRKEVHQEKELIHIELPGGRSRKCWTWKFDRKEYNPGFDTLMDVVAIEL